MLQKICIAVFITPSTEIVVEILSEELHEETFTRDSCQLEVLM